MHTPTAAPRTLATTWWHRLTPWLAALWATAALGDRGALSLDVAAGGVATAVPAHQAQPREATISYDGSFWVGGRYALSNILEVAASGFFEPPVTVFHNGVTLQMPSGAFPGTLQHTFTRFGAQAGLRLVVGKVWRVHLGFEVGWAQQLYLAQRHLDTSLPSGAVDYGLQLPDTSVASLVLSPVVGVEWALGDAWSLAVLPRFQVLVGGGVSWALVVPLQFSWGWYL